MIHERSDKYCRRNVLLNIMSSKEILNSKYLTTNALVFACKLLNHYTLLNLLLRIINVVKD